jgi:hypothetical protein
MTRVIVDPGLRRKLGDLSGTVEFVDESGLVLGYFAPANRDAWEFQPSVSDEELLRRAEGPQGRPLADILKTLESR